MNDSEIALSEAEKEANYEVVDGLAKKLDSAFSSKRGPISGGAFYMIEAWEPEGNEFGRIGVRQIAEYGEERDYDYGGDSASLVLKKEPDGKLSFSVSGDVEGISEVEESLIKLLKESGL